MTDRQLRNIGASVRARLLERSRNTGEGFQFLLQRYGAERFLHRLGESPYRERFVLKGAMLLALWGEAIYRPTRDLDFTGYGSSFPDDIRSAIRDICSVPVTDDGIVFNYEALTIGPIRGQDEYDGLRARFDATLDGARIRMRIDIGFGNAIQPPPIDARYPVLLDSPHPRIRVYPREAVVAEKLHAMVTHGELNSRYKDFSLPPSSEQRDIANFLDRETAKIDALLANKERLIELLQEKRTALITRTVTKGLDSDVPMKDAGVEWLGEVPAHWEVKRINQLSEILRGKFSHRPRNDPALYDGPYPFIQTGEVARARKEITSFRQTLNERGLNVSKLFPSGTLVMTIAANIGDVAVLDFSACFPDSVVGFVPRTGVERDFLFYGFLAMKPKLLREAPVNTQGNLNIQRIGSRENPMPVPSQSEQRAIADYLDRETMKIDALIAKVREAIDRLKELRAALISAAVTGKIDVRQTAARSR